MMRHNLSLRSVDAPSLSAVPSRSTLCGTGGCMVLHEISLDESGFIPDLSADPLIGTVLGSYELVARSSVGGTGVLYRARHSLLGWARAMKLFPATPSADNSYVKRFVREAKLAAHLHHPNVVHIHDI